MINSVYLYKCGRNLNRAYRTVEFFSVNNLCLVDCDAKLSGNLYKSKGLVNVVKLNNLPDNAETMYLEVNGNESIDKVDFTGINTIVLGGENVTLKTPKISKKVRIINTGKIDGLTVEAALAITLYKIWESNKN